MPLSSLSVKPHARPGAVRRAHALAARTVASELALPMMVTAEGARALPDVPGQHAPLAYWHAIELVHKLTVAPIEVTIKREAAFPTPSPDVQILGS